MFMGKDMGRNMSKKMRPSLKDYLRTGKVRMEPEEPPSRRKDHEEKEPRKSAPGTDKFLKLLTPHDLQVWQPIARTETEIQELPLDLVSLREDFRTMDRARFTFYTLEGEGTPLRPIRTSVQIREPLLLALKWDETGILTLYWPQSRR
jgi:hypothetical protein